MSYIFSKHIRIKTCNEVSFLVNIKNNSVFQVNTSALKYLQRHLSEGLIEEELSMEKSAFKDFVVALKQNGILEVAKDEH